MKTYWDLSEKERANLTDEQVGALCEVELMQAGVLKAVKPNVMTDPKEAEPLKLTQMWSVGDLLFDSMESALKCLELRPQNKAYDYDVGYDKQFGEPVTDKPKAIAICDRDEVLARKAELSEYKAKKDEIKRANDEYEKQCKAVKDALGGLWEDYYEQRGKLHRYQQIMDTLTEYEKLAGGDKNIARGFLEKAFDADDIVAAKEWFA